LADVPHVVTVKPFFLDVDVLTRLDGKSFVLLEGCPTRQIACVHDPSLLVPILVPGYNVSVSADKDESGEWCDLGQRIVTEAEWEYAATAAGTRIYPWGDEKPDCDRAFFQYPTCTPRGDTVFVFKDVELHWPRVGSYPSTAEGLFDMAGIPQRVAPSPEAYQDTYPAVPVPATPEMTKAWCASPKNPPDGCLHIPGVRGGDPYLDSRFLRSAYRRVGVIGANERVAIRCARSAD
jgi:formylglycine-generating enzyme required for sulfatase activity